MIDTDRFATELSAYVTCLLWQASDDEGDSLDQFYEVEDFTPESLSLCESELADFIRLCDDEGCPIDALPVGQAGHDFCLTRNRHGAGFWDRGNGAYGDDLTKWAHSFGSVDVYVNDKGQLEVS